MRQRKSDAWLSRKFLTLEYYSYKFSGRSARRGPKSNPVENIVFYIVATILRKKPMPNRSRPLTWKEIQETFNAAADRKPEEQSRDVVSYYPRCDGTYFEVITPVDRFDAALGTPTFKRVHLSISGIRYRVRQGKKIFDLINQNRKERPDLFPEISVKPVKKRAKIIPPKAIVEIVARKAQNIMRST
jgi:hypothetical protein